MSRRLTFTSWVMLVVLLTGTVLASACDKATSEDAGQNAACIPSESTYCPPAS